MQYFTINMAKTYEKNIVLIVKKLLRTVWNLISELPHIGRLSGSYI